MRVAAAQTAAVGELVADCREHYDADLTTVVAESTPPMTPEQARGLLNHPMATVLQQVVRERKAARLAANGSAAEREVVEVRRAYCD